MRGGLDDTPAELVCYGEHHFLSTYFAISHITLFYTYHTPSTRRYAPLKIRHLLLMYPYLFDRTGHIEEFEADEENDVAMVVVPKTTAKERRKEERRIKFGDRQTEVPTV